jgi:hypothetical protein
MDTRKFLKYSLAVLASSFFLVATPQTAFAQRGISVAVVAHSISTRVEARKVLARQGWTETTNLRQADGILVVCRSGLNWPLNDAYRSFKELNDDADSQLNISGSNFHIYVYKLNNNLSVEKVAHQSFPAD